MSGCYGCYPLPVDISNNNRLLYRVAFYYYKAQYIKYFCIIIFWALFNKTRQLNTRYSVFAIYLLKHIKENQEKQWSQTRN